MSADKGSPVAQWQALSSLYEQACDLDAGARREMLEALAASDPSLHDALQRMLQARDEADADNFLGALPRLEAPPALAGSREGVRIGPYKLLRRLGAGGMAEVWLGARDDGAFRRQVAIKLPYARLAPGTDDRDGTALARRFDRERDILASLRHPHIAGLIDAGVSDAGEAWLALEYVEGEPIGRWCDAHRATLRERVRLFRQVLLAVQHAHANLVIHRDLKPANILVTADGEVRLLDFGIAKLLEGNAVDETELTRLGGSPLTPRYAAPEQLTGAPLTTACDVYALGVVFYELIAGASPYETKVDTVSAIERAIVESEPRAPSRRALDEAGAAARGTSVKAWRRSLAPELDAIALKCLGKTPAQRYSSVDALIADVDRWLGGEAVLARAPGPWARAWKFALRNRLGVGFGAAAIVALVATAAVAIQSGLQARQESARAGAARDFMLELFKRADDEKAGGADITARELLDAGRIDVLARLAGQPTLQIELLRGIAEVQQEMNEWTHVDLTWAELVRLQRSQGLRRDAAVTLARRALNAQRLIQGDRAAKLLAEAHETHPEPARDSHFVARSELARGWIEIGARRPGPALEAFRRAQAAAGAMASEVGHAIHVDAGWGIVDALRRLGRVADAERAYEVQLSRQSEMGVLPKRTAAWNATFAMEFDYAVGRYAKVAAAGGDLLARCDRGFGPDSSVCRQSFLILVNTGFWFGQTALSEATLTRLRKIAGDTAAPARAFDATAALFRAELMAGADGDPWLGQLLHMSRPSADVALGPLFHAHAQALAAQLELRDQKAAQALARLEAALAALPTGGSGSRTSATVRFLTGVAHTQLGATALGLQWMQAGRRDLVATLTAEHPIAAVYDQWIAIAHHREGRNADALQILDGALPRLHQAFGGASSIYSEALALRDQIAAGQRPPTVRGPLLL